MPAPIEPPAVSFSEALFRRLLAVYPRGHREEYGAPMTQLFRDQCREAWSAARGRGVLKLWLRVLPDLLRTSALEHLTHFKRRKFIPSILRPYVAPLFVCLAVFVFVLGTTALITFLLPETFVSTARIRVQRDVRAESHAEPSPTAGGYDPYFVQAEFEVIQSETVLGRVVESLNLNALWGKKYARGGKLKTTDTVALLKRTLDLRPVRNTELIEIRAYSESPEEAAAIANAVAESYRDLRLERSKEAVLHGVKLLKEQFAEQEEKLRLAQDQVSRLRTELKLPTPEPSLEESGQYTAYWEARKKLEEMRRFSQLLNTKILSETVTASLPRHLVEIIDRAQPGLRPVRPNKPLNLFIGTVLGALLGLAAGIGTAGIHFFNGRNPPPSPASQPA